MIDPRLISAAKRDLARIRANGDTTKLSDEDRALLRRYPKSTLAAARLIDNAPLQHGIPGYSSGFEKIVAQERGNFHLSGDHT